MPIFEYQILDDDGNPTGVKFEKLCKREEAHEIITSSEGRKARKCLSIPARMNAQWAGAAGTLFGVNGKYNKGLGRVVNSYAEIDQIAEARGLVRLDDIGNSSQLIEEQIEKQDREEKKLAKLAGETW